MVVERKQAQTFHRDPGSYRENLERVIIERLKERYSNNETEVVLSFCDLSQLETIRNRLNQ